GIAACSQSHRRGEGSAFVETHGGATLEVGANQQRDLRSSLQLVCERRGRVGLAFDDAERGHLRYDDEAAGVQVLHVMQDGFVSRAVGGSKAAVEGGEEQLADLLVGRQLAQRGFHPVLSGRRELFERGLGRRILRATGRRTAGASGRQALTSCV